MSEDNSAISESSAPKDSTPSNLSPHSFNDDDDKKLNPLKSEQSDGDLRMNLESKNELLACDSLDDAATDDSTTDDVDTDDSITDDADVKLKKLMEDCNSLKDNVLASNSSLLRWIETVENLNIELRNQKTEHNSTLAVTNLTVSRCIEAINILNSELNRHKAEYINNIISMHSNLTNSVETISNLNFELRDHEMNYEANLSTLNSQLDGCFEELRNHKVECKANLVTSNSFWLRCNETINDMKTKLQDHKAEYAKDINYFKELIANLQNENRVMKLEFEKNNENQKLIRANDELLIENLKLKNKIQEMNKNLFLDYKKGLGKQLKKRAAVADDIKLNILNKEDTDEDGNNDESYKTTEEADVEPNVEPNVEEENIEVSEKCSISM